MTRSSSVTRRRWQRRRNAKVGEEGALRASTLPQIRRPPSNSRLSFVARRLRPAPRSQNSSHPPYAVV